ncbi:hypothetical protein ABS71_21845 [bacterium SCN 62-11]|nr:MAG: hypothetical protein ABS71_21845 [bacterium SCN 62-11]
MSEVMTRRYRLVSLLGQGGMGRVFLCEGEEGRVAVKVTRLGEDLRQFRHEAQMLKGLSHPHLVSILDYLEEDQFGYLVMDYVPGETLAQRVSRQGPVPVAQVLNWALQLCEVLEYLHRQNPKILFRDLKPSNVMVDSQDQLKLIDFGIARLEVTGVMTATFLQGIGSAGYAPLEQYQGAGSTDERSDIYSLGATLFHLLTGRTPPSPIDVVAEDSQVPSVRYLNPNVPPWLDSVIKKMMATRKENRFASASEAGMALRRMLSVEDEPTEVLAAPQRRADNVLYALTGVLTTAAVGLMGWLFVTSQATSEPLPPATPPVVIAAAAPPAAAAVQEAPLEKPVVVASRPAAVKPKVVKKPTPVVSATPRPVLPEIAYPRRSPVMAAVKKVEETPAPEVPVAPRVSVAEPEPQPPVEIIVPEVKPTPTPSATPPTYSISVPPPGNWNSHGQYPGGGSMQGGGPMMGGGGFNGGGGMRR